jgi:hypothetical protein
VIRVDARPHVPARVAGEMPCREWAPYQSAGLQIKLADPNGVYLTLPAPPSVRWRVNPCEDTSDPN